MRRRTKARRQNRQKTKQGLPDLEHVKTAVLVSLRSPESQRSYQRSIEDFVCWYCSEPRLSFNKTVVTRYRIHLEDRLLAPGTINVRLAAVRRLAYEAADTGLLSPDLAAGIRRVRGAKKLGIRLGNWLTVEEARTLWQLPNVHTVKGKRDKAMLAVLLGCGLRRRELIDLTVDHLQRREEYWAIVEPGGKRRAYPYCPDAGLGEGKRRRLVKPGKDCARAHFSMRLSKRCGLGNEDHRKGGLARREEIRREAGNFKTRAT
jgi:integrase